MVENAVNATDFDVSKDVSVRYIQIIYALKLKYIFLNPKNKNYVKNNIKYKHNCAETISTVKLTHPVIFNNAACTYISVCVAGRVADRMKFRFVIFSNLLCVFLILAG